MRVLLITSEWPTEEHPEWVPFLVKEIKALRDYGIDIEVFHFRGNRNPISYIKAWIKLRREYELKKFDLIHAEWGQSALLALPKQRPLITTFRGSDLEGIVDRSGKYAISGKILQCISKVVALLSDDVILVSDGMRKFLPKVQYHVLPVCLDQEIFIPMDKSQARKVLGLPEDEFLVLFPANPERMEKRYWLAEKAVETLQNSIPVRLVVTRNVPHEMMPYYLNACDALLITSSHEGSPTIVFESLACNLPIVSVDVGDVRSRIEGIKGCFTCENDTPETIGKALHQVYLFGGRICGRESIREMTIENFVQRMHKIYQANLNNEE